MNALRSLLSRDMFAGPGGRLTDKLLKGKAAYAAHAGALALVAALGWIDGSAPPDPPAQATARTDQFTMPTWSPVQLGEGRARALAMIAFEPDPAETETAAATAPTPEPVEDDPADATKWRFIGTARRGADMVAFVIVANGKKLMTVSMADPLPNGERIEAIGPDRLVIADDAGRRELKLFETQEPKTEDAP